MADARKRIALIAHDKCKPRLVEWAQAHRDVLARHVLPAPGGAP